MDREIKAIDIPLTQREFNKFILIAIEYRGADYTEICTMLRNIAKSRNLAIPYEVAYWPECDDDGHAIYSASLLESIEISGGI